MQFKKCGRIYFHYAGFMCCVSKRDHQYNGFMEWQKCIRPPWPLLLDSLFKHTHWSYFLKKQKLKKCIFKYVFSNMYFQICIFKYVFSNMYFQICIFKYVFSNIPKSRLLGEQHKRFFSFLLLPPSPIFLKKNSVKQRIKSQWPNYNFEV